MTREEFDLWLDHHSLEVFPGVDCWLHRMPPSKLLAVLRGWWVKLQHVQIEHAQRASQALLDGGTDPPFGQHAVKVVALAKKYVAKRPDDTFDGVDMPTAEQRLAASKRQLTIPEKS